VKRGDLPAGYDAGLLRYMILGSPGMAPVTYHSGTGDDHLLRDRGTVLTKPVWPDANRLMMLGAVACRCLVSTGRCILIGAWATCGTPTGLLEFSTLLASFLCMASFIADVHGAARLGGQ
jgi:hypothetical protein